MKLVLQKLPLGLVATLVEKIVLNLLEMIVLIGEILQTFQHLECDARSSSSVANISSLTLELSALSHDPS